jgi:hypothetical protein
LRWKWLYFNRVFQHDNALAFTATTGIPTLDQIKGLYDTAMAILGKPQEHITAADLKGIADQAGDYLKDAEADGNVRFHRI